MQEVRKSQNQDLRADPAWRINSEKMESKPGDFAGLNYTRIYNTHKVHKKTRFFIMWLLYVQLLGEHNRQRRRSSGRAGVSERVEGNEN